MTARPISAMSQFSFACFTILSEPLAVWDCEIGETEKLVHDCNELQSRARQQAVFFLRSRLVAAQSDLSSRNTRAGSE